MANSRNFITYKQFNLIEFPIVPLPKDVWYDGEILWKGDKVVDDRSVDMEYLGYRRLHTNKPLYQLNMVYSTLREMITSMNLEFLDRKGRYFYYKKTRYLNIISKRIKKIKYWETYSTIQLYECKDLFKLNVPPPPTVEWAQVLYLGSRPWALYSYSNEELPKSRKKV